MGSTSVGEYKSNTKEIVVIFIILSVLTLIEVSIPGAESLTRKVKIALLSTLAVVKVFIVAWWHMHLKEEKAWLKFIAILPVSAVVYTLVAVLESIYR